MFKSIRAWGSALSSLTIVSATAFAGGWTTGGGTAVKTPHGKVLSDLLASNPEFTDTYRLRDSKLPKLTSDSKASKKLGYEILNLKKLPSMKTLMRRLALWESNSPYLVDLLRASLEGTRFRYSSRYAAGPEIQPWVPTTVGMEEAEVLIFYKEGFGAIFQLSSFLELGDLSRAGAILHEAGRRYQKDMGANISETALHTLIGKIMTSWPRKANELETSEFLGDFFVKLPDPFSENEKHLCELLTKSIELSKEYFYQVTPETRKILLDGKSDSCSGRLEEKFANSFDTRDHVRQFYYALRKIRSAAGPRSVQWVTLETCQYSILNIQSDYNLAGAFGILNEIRSAGFRIQNVTEHLSSEFGLAEESLIRHYNGEKIFKSGSGSVIRQATEWIKDNLDQAVDQGYLVEVN